MVINANNIVKQMVSGTCHLQYNITCKWISGTQNKAAACLLQLVDVKDTPATPTVLINMLVTSTPDGPATWTHSKICNTANTTAADTMPTSTNDKINTPLTLRADQKDMLRLIQRRDPFCKYISEINQ